MEKKYIKITLIIILLSFLIMLIVPKMISLTGFIIENHNYSYTKAICDEENFCQDYEIICKADEIIINPIPNTTIKNPDNWEDFREDKEICFN